MRHKPEIFGYARARRRAGQLGASVAEAVVAAGIVAASAGAAANAVGNQADLRKTDKLQANVDFLESMFTEMGRNGTRATGDGASDPCFSSHTFESALTRTRTLTSPSLTIQVDPVNSYASAFGATLPSEWTAAAATCSTAPNTDACIKITVKNAAGKVVNSGLLVARSQVWNYAKNQKAATCDDSTETEPGMGYKMTYNLMIEAPKSGSGAYFANRKFMRMYANTVDGNFEIITEPDPPSQLQGPNMLGGSWRGLWEVPPEPGPDYVAWPIPYQVAGGWVYDKSCGAAYSTCPIKYKIADYWQCNGTLYSGECQKGRWFK